MVRIVVLSLWVLAATTVAASTLLVLPDGSGPYPDIQTAVVAAADGDTILLGDGVFMGAGNRNLLLDDRTLTFRSQADDPLLCSVDLEENQFLQCSGSAQDSVTLVNLGLRHGFVVGSGGCIRSFGLELVLIGCSLEDSRSDWWEAEGGAISVQGGSLLIADCALTGNSCAAYAGGVGGAIATQDAAVTITRTVFAANLASSTFDSGGRGGAVAVAGGAALINDCEFRGNRIGYTNLGAGTGGAVVVSDATVAVTGCVFVENEAEGRSDGGAVALHGSPGAITSCTFLRNGASGFGSPDAGGSVFVREGNLTLEACIIAGAWGRDWEGGEPIPENAAAVDLGTITATDCDVWGNGKNWTGPLAGQDGHDGNFAANPCFCDSLADDLHLCADSWCAPEHNVAHPGVLVGALPVGCEACDCDDALTPVNDAAPAALRLLGASPNPFNPATVIRFVLPTTGSARLRVYDLAGRRVATLIDGHCEAGEQTETWRGCDDDGRPAAGGTYLLRLEAAGIVVTDKLTLLK